MSLSDPAYTTEELLAVVLARLIENARHVVVGANSPIPASAALLARELSGQAMEVTILGSRRYNPFTDGGKELFDYAAQGRIDAFFLGGGQIDGRGNINLVGIGQYPGDELRLPGCYGSAFLYYLVPNIILFRQEHSPRVLVPRVDFVSAPGVTPPNIHRVGGPKHLVTEMAQMAFDADVARFRLTSLHPGRSLDEVIGATGFVFDHAAPAPTTRPPETDYLELLRGPVREALRDLYPRFVSQATGTAGG